MTLADMLATLTLAGLAAGMGTPIAGRFLDELKLDAASRTLVFEINRARARAITRGQRTGIRFDPWTGGGAWRHYDDGGSPGLSSAEIDSGVDPPAGSSRHLGAEHPGVRIGLPDRPVPEIPPASGLLLPSSDPVALGATDLFSASPGGGTTGGTLYVTDGENLRALVIYGPTGRVRLWEFSSRDGLWRGPL